MRRQAPGGPETTRAQHPYPAARKLDPDLKFHLCSDWCGSANPGGTIPQWAPPRRVMTAGHVTKARERIQEATAATCERQSHQRGPSRTGS
jgi:hypothetical protein